MYIGRRYNIRKWWREGRWYHLWWVLEELWRMASALQLYVLFSFVADNIIRWTFFPWKPGTTRLGTKRKDRLNCVRKSIDTKRIRKNCYVDRNSYDSLFKRFWRCQQSYLMRQSQIHAHAEKGLKIQKRRDLLESRATCVKRAQESCVDCADWALSGDCWW
jgi:hypothetical protein